MHIITGAFSLDKALSDDIFNSVPIYENSGVISIQTETSVDSNFIHTVETKSTFAICTGYFDQPLSEDRKVNLESIVEAYEVNGELPYVDLFGSFQCFLFDKKTERLMLFSDRGGLRTIFYCISNGVLYFSTKVKAIQKLTDFAGQPNVSQRDFSLIYGFYPEDTTVYENVRKLTAGKGLSIKLGSIQVVQFSGQKEFLAPNLKSEDDVVEQLYKDLFSAIEKQTTGYDRVAVLLGGFDSALIASFLKRLGKEVETYTFSFEDSSFNQAHTDTLAKYLGIKHNWVKIDPSAYLHVMSQYSTVFDSPTNWTNYVAQTAYSTEQIRKDGFDLCLTGDGCDSIFLGYPGVNRSSNFYNKISPVLKPLSSPLIWLMNWKFLEEKLGHVYRLILRVIRNAATENPARTFLMYRIFDETTIARTFKESDYSQVKSSVKTSFDEYKDNIPSEASLGKLAYMGRSNMGPNRAKLSGAMDLTGVILHSPFMHNEIKKLVGCYPDHLLRPQDSGNTMSDIGKYVLIKMTQKFELLPNEIIFQKKDSPVNSPIDDWYREDIHEFVLKTLEESPWSIDSDFVKKSMILKKIPEEIYKLKYSADKVATHSLSLLLSTLSFYEK